VSTKLDFARFELKTAERDDEGRSNAFWLFGVGWGFTDWLSGYVFVPFTAKVVEDNSYNTAGFTDVSVLVQAGFKWDEGLRRIPPNESLDDLEDWHFTVYTGGTVPTGDEDVANADGDIDPGMALGFGTPSGMLGANVTKMLGRRSTAVLDVSGIGFLENEYADGTETRFGSELRVNLAWAQRLVTSAERRMRFDGILEANFLALGRDRTDGIDEEGTGGAMLYLQPGVRFYRESFSAAVGVKFPVWTDLHEEDLQQGAEGTEEARLQVTLSSLF
jgi:hypothetical protein